MTTSKGLGALAGAGIGVAVAALSIDALNAHAPASGRAAAILFLALICAALGAYIGSDDRTTRKSPPGP